MNFTIEAMPSYDIAYIRRIGPYGAENKETMGKLKIWAQHNGLLNDEAVVLGIAQDNPISIKPDNCRYDTCIVLGDNYSINDTSVNIGKTAGGKYAVFMINHTAEAVQKAWMEIFPELSKQHYQIDETRPIIERYAVKMVNNHYCEICVPVY
jgi:DNA gyrase inhibitor GyrI